MAARGWGPVAAGLLLGVVLTGGVLPALVDGDDGRQTVGAATGGADGTISGQGRQVATGAQLETGPGDAAPAPPEAGGEAAGSGLADGSPSGATTHGADAPGAGSAATTDAAGDGQVVAVGVLLIDLGGVSRIGFAAPGLDPREQRRWYEVFFDELNAAGGVGGREVEAVYATYDPTSNDSQRAACLALTEDAPVLAVLENTGGYRGPNVLCFTKEHGVPFLSTFHRHNDEEMRLSGELLLGYGMSASRNLANLVHELDGLGRLADRTIGVLESARAGDRATNDAGVVRPLESLGHQVAIRFVTSEDLNTAASQIPLAVREMRAAGVDLVFLDTNVLVSTQFVNAAEGQLYTPTYVTSEWYGLSTDFGAGQMSPSFEGALTVVAERDGEYNTPDRPEPPIERDCRETVARATGEDYPLGSDQNNLVVQTCGVVRLFGAGARAAGADPSRTALTGAIQRLGPVDPPRVAPGLFRPGRYDAASHTRVKVWAASCRCWRIVRDFQPARV